MEDERTISQLVDEVRTGRLDRRAFVRSLTKLGLTTAGISTVVAATLTSPSSTPLNAAQPARQGQPQVEPHEQLRLHEQHLHNQMAQNTPALHNDYAPDALVEDSLHAQHALGREAIMARKQLGMAAIPDLQIEVTNRVAQGQQICVEWIASGTHVADLPGLPASNRTFTIRGVTVAVRQEGQIIRETLYYDAAEVQRQLG